MRQIKLSILLCLLVFGAANCGKSLEQIDSSGPAVSNANPSGNILRGRVGDFNADVDYFPDKTSFQYARQLKLEYRGNYKIVTFTPNVKGDILRYVLVQRGTKVPDLPEMKDPLTRVFEVPLERIAMGSMRYGGATDLLDVVDQVNLVSGLKAITTQSILDRIKDGRILEQYSSELLMERKVDAAMAYYSNSGESLTMQKDLELGINRVAMAEHLEESPLGRSEWIKFFALFFNREKTANEKFGDIEKRYLETAEKVRLKLIDVKYRPKILVNYNRGDSWPVYGGKNGFARLVEDAGGDYLFKDLPYRHSNFDMPLEAVYDKGSEADVWIVSPDFSSTFADGKPRFDERLKKLKANDELFVTFNPTTGNRNPWWDGGLIHPDEELMDYVKILHPELMPDHKLRFLRKINTEQ